MTNQVIPEEAIEAAAWAMLKEHRRGSGSKATALAALEAAAPHMLAAATDLIRALTDPDDCWFDHHGGCQAHGYDLQPGEKCPQAKAKEWAK